MIQGHHIKYTNVHSSVVWNNTIKWNGQPLFELEMQWKSKYFLLQNEKGQKDQCLAVLRNINWLLAQRKSW